MVSHIAANKYAKMFITHEKRSREALSRDSIIFDDVDALIFLHHNDALVIKHRISDINFKHVLIYPGSSVNVIHSTVIEEMQLIDKVIPSQFLSPGSTTLVRQLMRKLFCPPF